MVVTGTISTAFIGPDGCGAGFDAGAGVVAAGLCEGGDEVGTGADAGCDAVAGAWPAQEKRTKTMENKTIPNDIFFNIFCLLPLI